MHNGLYHIDLNLLKLFHSLYCCRSVTQAAQQMHLSQSAFSHALSRLRQQLGDPLFIRSASAMIPTPYADAISVEVGQVLDRLSDCLLSKQAFSPALSQHAFRIAVTDFTALMLMSRLAKRISTLAPKVRLNLIHDEQRMPLSRFETGQLDFALGFSHDDAEGHRLVSESLWWEGDYCTLASSKVMKMNRDIFLASRHILVSPWGTDSGIVDQVLASLGLSRDIAIQLPNVINAPFLVEESGYLVTLPRQAAHLLAHSLPLNEFDVPLPMPSYKLTLMSYKPTENTPENLWLREQINGLFDTHEA
ncbi:LysR family transcriptional regulator [Shewanella insulae]|uniref:LysR family transcriptional regulator n=1 Tax=Shewanella insulae TaxID=2681496 RepID=UPI001EFC487C|nr:LysR family transcriptional regulator [Shewanella insulae]MCG9740212.1 LysR family transcriptional regulator [Shewanella insulae]